MPKPYHITDYQPHSKDYHCTKLSVGLCEIQGKRPKQQDALTVCQQDLAYFAALPPEVRANLLKQTVADMQTAHGNWSPGGSTLCGVIAWQDRTTQYIHLDSVNVGDSAAYLVLLNTNHELLFCQRLNDLHNLDPQANPTEYNRVCESGFTPVLDGKAYRLNYSLMLSRSIGDKQYENYGLSHLPDINHYSNLLQEGHSAYVVLACDGLDTLSAACIGKTIASQARVKASSEAMATQLVSLAYQTGSTDNISVAVFKTHNTPSSALVLDGHGVGGGTIARSIARDFYPELHKKTVGAFNHFVALQKERIEKERRAQQIAEMKQRLAQLSGEEKIQMLKNTLITSTKIPGNFLQLDQNLSTLISTTHLNVRFSIEGKTFLTVSSGQYNQASIYDMECIEAYNSLSDTDKNNLIDGTISILKKNFAIKKEFFIALATQLNNKINAIKAHIAVQPTHNERWRGFFTTKNQGAKIKLLKSIEKLTFDPTTIPVQANLSDYEKIDGALTELLRIYEAELTKNKSIRHLNNYKDFKESLNTLEATLNSPATHLKSLR